MVEEAIEETGMEGEVDFKITDLSANFVGKLDMWSKIVTIDMSPTSRVQSPPHKLKFLSRRNRFEGCRIDSLDLNPIKSLNFEVIKSIRSSSEPIRFWAETQASNLNQFV
ncbi:hypothetical protein PIB30_026473 [Stylosanthes scabra]|uniref:Uncharacterized protein n=1 Tax=Stylosanthes scabra TaxID=79078 RepID=A0ABU6WDG3_9FABA|nr:hypothetical protein [Stylosanthes scabra]